MPRVGGGLLCESVVVVVPNTDGGEGELLHGVVHGEGLFPLQMISLGLTDLVRLGQSTRIPVIKLALVSASEEKAPRPIQPDEDVFIVVRIGTP